MDSSVHIDFRSLSIMLCLDFGVFVRKSPRKLFEMLSLRTEMFTKEQKFLTVARIFLIRNLLIKRKYSTAQKIRKLIAGLFETCGS